MTSAVDPKKLKSLLNKSQTELDEPADEEGAEPEGETSPDADADEGEEGGAAEVTVESLTADLKDAVPTINEIIDEFRTGSEDQPKKGVEQLEEELDAELVHGMCAWAEEAGKKDFRKLGEALDVEDVDGFVGWMRAVRKMEEEGEGEGEGEDEGDEGEGGEGGGEEAAGGEEQPEGGEGE